jgi:integrase
MRGCLRRAKTKDGRTWRIILALGRGADGKHKQKWVTFHGTKKQAEQKLTDLVGEVNHGEFVEASKTTVGAYLDKWMETAIRPRCVPNTYVTYSGIVEKHLKPALGHLLLQRLTPLDVERYYSDCRATLKERTIMVHRAILTTALDAAVTEEVLRRNVAKRATNKPRMRRTSGNAVHNVWNADEAHRFLDAVKKEGNAQYTALFALALDSGLRKGEIRGLQWKDLEGTRLRVDRQVFGQIEDEVGAFHLDSALPKGKQARSTDLSEETVVLLREHKRQQSEVKLKNRPQYVDHGLMFAQSWEHKSNKNFVLGSPLHRTTIGAELDRLCRASGVKRITVHGLRHTCATLTLLAGVPAHVVQERLGHANVEMTLSIYSHVLPGQQEDAASRLAMLLHG